MVKAPRLCQLRANGSRDLPDNHSQISEAARLATAVQSGLDLLNLAALSYPNRT